MHHGERGTIPNINMQRLLAVGAESQTVLQVMEGVMYRQVRVATKGVSHQIQQFTLCDDVLAEQRQTLEEVLILLPVAHPMLHLHRHLHCDTPFASRVMATCVSTMTSSSAQHMSSPARLLAMRLSL